MSGNESRLKALQERYGEWEIWVVPRAVAAPVWCARRNGAAVAQFNAGSAEELERDLAQEEGRFS